MKQIEGGVTAAKGYTTAGTRAGIKKGKTNKDMAMIFSEKPAVTAGTFTKNLVKAAPVLCPYSRRLRVTHQVSF